MDPEFEIAIRVACAMAVFAAMGLWEVLAPRRPWSLGRMPRWPNNLAVLVVDALAVRVLIPTAAVGAALFAGGSGIGLFNLAGVPLWPAVILGFLVLDLAIYTQHYVFHHVPVLWRPLHEANGRWFWWGAKGPEPLRKLWQMMFVNFTAKHRLNNLIWVFSPGAETDLADWYPGGPADNVTLTYGGSEANLLALWTVLGPRDRLPAHAAARRLSAVRLAGHEARHPLRGDAVPGAVRVPRLPRAVRSLQGALGGRH